MHCQDNQASSQFATSGRREDGRTHSGVVGVVAVSIGVHAVAAFTCVARSTTTGAVTEAFATLRSPAHLVVVEGTLAALSVTLAVLPHVARQVALTSAAHTTTPVRTRL